MRVILVPVADRPESVTALNTAFTLAVSLGANVHGCHISAHSVSEETKDRDISSDNSDVTEWHAQWKMKNTATSISSAKTMFSGLADHHDYSLIKRPKVTPGAIWLEKLGSPDKVLANVGPISDLVIVSRPADGKGKMARLFLKAALFKSARPVLVLPQVSNSSIGQRISIAWNQSTGAAQALAAAMPLLRNAEYINIITCGSERRVGPKSTQVLNYLRYWGVKAQRTKVKGKNEGEAILQAHVDSNCDLLVMGAYSHNRLRQRLLGGVTDFMLRQANIPVFMLHT